MKKSLELNVYIIRKITTKVSSDYETNKKIRKKGQSKRLKSDHTRVKVNRKNTFHIRR